MMKLEKRFFTELPNDARYIREKVFVEEQGFQHEFDDYDKQAIHLVVYYGGYAVATGRVFTAGNKNKVYTIGRVAVLQEYRSLHLGSKVLKFLEEKAKDEGAEKIELSAQCSAQDFYRKNGYITDGDIYYDEFCPHIHMEKNL